MIYTAEQLERFRNEAKAKDLSAPSLFWDTAPEQLRYVCNGCGAEEAPKWQRDVLTWIYRHYAPAHCIHDCDFELSDGSDENFAAANLRFHENLLRLWRCRYGSLRWINPIALWGRNKIRLAYKAVCLCGKGAWLAAYARRLAEEVSL